MYKRWNNIYYKSYNSLVLVTPRIKQSNKEIRGVTSTRLVLQ
jgi:hypothetical protein